MHLMQAITNLGDSAILLPLSLIVAAAIWRFQSRLAAGWFLGAFALCATVMTLLKVAFLTCSHSWGTNDIVSPSGHASLSAAFYGSLALVAARQARPWQRPLIVAGASGLVAAVAASRVILGVHSPAEVAIGLSVGLAACALFAVQYLRRPAPPIRLVLLCALLAGAVLLMYGSHLHAEHVVRQIAPWLRRWAGLCTGT
jgi:membrane-associated phospholipid phosphatase